MSSQDRNIKLLDKSIEEAQRFIERAVLAKESIHSNEFALIIGSPETAAVKRASMDLTRQLARLRQDW